MRRVLNFGLVAMMAIPSAALSQAASDVIAREGASKVVPAPTFPPSKDLIYRIAWGVNVGPDSAHGVVPGFRSAANFLVVGNANGVPRANVRQAIVVWGTATHSLLKNEAYRALKKTDNASAPLLQALHDAGVEIIVCGEALLNRNIARADLLPFVKIAPNATMALATLHAQGYAIFRP